jgi:uncharacterized membrane protein YccC
MDWAQVLTIIGSNIALFIWARTESNSDRKQLENIINADRKDMLQIIREIKDEMKDFHGRLCSIEERNKK